MFNFNGVRKIRDQMSIKKFIVKLTLFLVITFFLQSLLSFYLLRFETSASRLNKYVFKFDEFVRLNNYLKAKTDIIYFGDSTIYTLGEGDKDERTTAGMVKDMTPCYSLGSITHAAYHMDLYLEFCRYITRQKNRPYFIIIPINMRSFSPEWDRRPQYQFEIEKIILRGGLLKQLVLAFYKPLCVFKYNFSTISRKEFLNTPVFNGSQQMGMVRDFNNKSYLTYSENNLKNSIIYFYMYTLNREHRKVKSMVEAATILTQNNITAIFYITPIDHETGEKYFPGQFLKRLRHNTQLICSLLEAEGVEVLDLSIDLTSKYFRWVRYPNEYLRQTGRKYVAEKISHILLNKEIDKRI